MTDTEIKSEEQRAKILSALQSVGMAALGAGEMVGRQAIELYRKIDPDVTRHLAQIPLLSYSLLGPRTEQIEVGEPDGHPPLVFVHGLGGSRGDFMPMSWTMWLGGRRRSYRIGFDGNPNIDEMADALARFGREVLQVTGERQIEIVAHSLGGVVARLALQQYGLAKWVKTLITLGSPHRGTHVARFANTSLTQALRPDSELMTRLNGQAWPQDVRGVSFWSQNDLIVLPASGAIADGTEAVDASPFTHYSYLIHPKCWAAVWKVLQGQTLSTVGI